MFLTFIPIILCAIADLTPSSIQRYAGIKSSTIFVTGMLGAFTYTAWAASCMFDLPFWGCKTKKEVYIALALYAVVYDPSTSYAGTIFTSLIPPGLESTFFSLFALTSKAGAFFGPLVLSTALQTTGNFYHGLAAMSMIIASAVLVFTLVHLEAGVRQAKGYDDPCEG